MGMMDGMTDPTRGVSRAVEVLTAWTEVDNEPASAQLFWSTFLQTVDEGMEAEIELTVGLAKLAGILLIKASTATGEAPVAILQDIGVKYAG